MEIGKKRFENGGSVLDQQPGRGYTGDRRSPTLWTRCHQDNLLVASYKTQGNGRRIMPPLPLIYLFCPPFITNQSAKFNYHANFVSFNDIFELISLCKKEHQRALRGGGRGWEKKEGGGGEGETGERAMWFIDTKV